jgi:riboflavin synthase
VAYVDSGTFKVSVIPHTQEQTTLTSKKVGDIVNLENDVLARYVEKLMKRESGGLSLEFLKENGF